MTTAKDVLAELAAMGTEQNQKIYRRHGVKHDLYGVSFANLKTLKKKVKLNHTVARELWQTGNHDARMFATMIADPKQANGELLESWVRDLDNYVISDAVSGYVSETALAQEKMEQWTQSSEEWVGAVGWTLMAHLAMKDKTLPDRYFEAYITRIEQSIHSAKNRVRYSMNNALIAIGTRSDVLEPEAIAAAQRIGPVAVDHGETNCKTPDAASYIKKSRDHRHKKTG